MSGFLGKLAWMRARYRGLVHQFFQTVLLKNPPILVKLTAKDLVHEAGRVNVAQSFSQL